MRLSKKKKKKKKNKDLLYSTGNSIQYPVINHTGKEYRKDCRDFTGDPVVKNSPSNAGDTGSNPGQGTKISHAAQHSQKKQFSEAVSALKKLHFVLSKTNKTRLRQLSLTHAQNTSL